MVKAFSYGSGSYEIANVLQFHHADYLAVAYADEGVELRNNGILLPIMVMCPEKSSFDSLIKNRLEPEIYSLEILNDWLNNLKKFYAGYDLLPLPIHIKIDSGMHRLGFMENDLDELMQIVNENKNFIKVKSVFSHLAASDATEHNDFTKNQFNYFKNFSEKIEKAIGYKFLKHILNSGGIAPHHEMQLDMVRLGIGLYGFDSAIDMNSKLKCVSKLKTTIIQLKEIEPTETIGYNRNGKLKKKSKIATVGIGYADGYKRSLGNGIGKMLLNGKFVPTIGNICMDMTMLDVSEINNVKVGDEVIVFGENPSLQMVSEWANTIPYEILTSISTRVKRIYFQE
jgi:Alr-MurF fusion protein